MKFSIILASRERVPLLIGLARSINETTADIDDTEMLVAIDDDDLPTIEASKQIREWYPFVKFAIRPRSNWLNGDYLNYVYEKLGSGKYIIACNDDAAFRTKGWDKILDDKLTEYLSDKPDGICMAMLEDGLPSAATADLNFCCFPLFSQAGVKILDGQVLPKLLPSWSADREFAKLYDSIGRIVDLKKFCYIEHLSYHCGKNLRDSISYNVEKLANSGFYTIAHVFNEYHYKLISAMNPKPSECPHNCPRCLDYLSHAKII